ncbi:hypothetical protein PMZ80_009950 [Knufia obscura]|uniref:Uncharacterized protein n=1 Tax=Knufia obscura TaxID=1635080 RepID=A0ABR0RB77_9EURO|nr:hypothetical protein PMZ80_009950 [Knufia obscura]
MSRNLLLDLPPELRNQVYVEVFRGARARPKGARRWSSSSRQFCDGNGPESAIDDAVHGFGLLTANKQVRDEGLAFFWKETLFDLQPLCDLISGYHWGTFQPGSLTRIENAVCTIVGAFRFSSPSFHEERMGVGATLRQLTTYYVSGSKAQLSFVAYTNVRIDSKRTGIALRRFEWLEEWQRRGSPLPIDKQLTDGEKAALVSDLKEGLKLRGNVQMRWQ